MDRQLGRVDMVRWQGRRPKAETRNVGRAARLALMFLVVAAASLAVGFWSGLPVPLELLQTVFAVVALALVIYGVSMLGHTLAHGRERRFH